MFYGNFDIFVGHLVHLLVCFGTFLQEKSGNPAKDKARADWFSL
jgi:hypothetical protein